VRSNAKLALVAAAGAAVGVLLARYRRPVEAPSAPSDRRAEELRQKLAEARAAVADENDFEAAGMGAETLVEEPAPEAPPAPAQAPPPPAAVEPAPEPAPEPDQEPKKEPAAEPPPADEFEAMRRRIHAESRAAAEEMRRSAEKPDQA
jgi:outer membrane biosynthesis protein TonB